uniref:Uncharacterized protein n=1 Tax=Arundo donax TaxID=35708 RepID=A0A0A8ZYE9_ARUDO
MNFLDLVYEDAHACNLFCLLCMIYQSVLSCAQLMYLICHLYVCRIFHSVLI